MQRSMRLYQAGKYAEATEIAKRVLAIREKALGPEHPTSAPRSTTWRALSRPGPLRRGRAALQARARHLREGAGARPPGRRHLAQQPGRALRDQGRYAEAEPLFKRCLAIREKALGPDHPDVGSSLNNLAGLYQRPGPLRRGRAALQARLAISEKALGPDHPDVGSSLNNLAELYRDQGRYAEAEPLYKRASPSARRRWGPTTPMSAARSTTWPSSTRPGPLRRGRAALQARPRHPEKALGPDHPDVGTRSTTWPSSIAPRAATPRPSRSTSAPRHPREGAGARPPRRRPHRSTTWPGCTATRAATPRPSRSTSAPRDRREGAGARPPRCRQRRSTTWPGSIATRAATPRPSRSTSAALAIAEKALGPTTPMSASSLNNLAGLASRKRDWARAADYWRRSTAYQRRAQRGTAGVAAGFSQRRG